MQLWQVLSELHPVAMRQHLYSPQWCLVSLHALSSHILCVTLVNVFSFGVFSKTDLWFSVFLSHPTDPSLPSFHCSNLNTYAIEITFFPFCPLATPFSLPYCPSSTLPSVPNLNPAPPKSCLFCPTFLPPFSLQDRYLVVL